MVKFLQFTIAQLIMLICHSLSKTFRCLNAVGSYISDMSTKQARTHTLGQLLSMNYFGYFIGSLAAGVLLALAEFDFVFGTVILVNCAAVLTTIFCMRESVAVVMSDTAEFRSRHFRFAVSFL